MVECDRVWILWLEKRIQVLIASSNITCSVFQATLSNIISALLCPAENENCNVNLLAFQGRMR